MVIQTKYREVMSIDAFDRVVSAYRDEGRHLEYIAGSAVEVTSNTYASKLAMWIAVLIGAYLLENDIGHITGADGGYMVSGERYIPDVAFVAYSTQAKVDTTGYNPNPPDLAIEVISNPDNTQEHEDLRRKITNYLAAGTVVWVFDWRKAQAEVHQPGQAVAIYNEADVIDGGDILPGFQLKLADAYRSRPESKS